jgi:hypothetical protein
MDASNLDGPAVAESIVRKLRLSNRLFCDIGPHAGQARFDVAPLFLTLAEQALLTDIQNARREAGSAASENRRQRRQGGRKMPGLSPAKEVHP